MPSHTRSERKKAKARTVKLRSNDFERTVKLGKRRKKK